MWQCVDHQVALRVLPRTQRLRDVYQDYARNHFMRSMRRNSRPGQVRGGPIGNRVANVSVP